VYYNRLPSVTFEDNMRTITITLALVFWSRLSNAQTLIADVILNPNGAQKGEVNLACCCRGDECWLECVVRVPHQCQNGGKAVDLDQCRDPQSPQQHCVEHGVEFDWVTDDHGKIRLRARDGDPPCATLVATEMAEKRKQEEIAKREEFRVKTEEQQAQINELNQEVVNMEEELSAQSTQIQEQQEALKAADKRIKENVQSNKELVEQARDLQKKCRKNCQVERVKDLDEEIDDQREHIRVIEAQLADLRKKLEDTNDGTPIAK